MPGMERWVSFLLPSNPAPWNAAPTSSSSQLDRLSREEILPAHTLFLSIVQAEINLVTLTDKRVYRAKTTNLVDMITSLVIMERAHENPRPRACVSALPGKTNDRRRSPVSQ